MSYKVEDYLSSVTISPKGEIENISDYFDEEPDNLFGRNKQKKAEKKLKRAEKKLSKGNVKAANRKIGKAQKILSGIEQGQQKQIEAVKTQKRIEGGKIELERIKNESLSTPPGNIGQDSPVSTPLPDTGVTMQTPTASTSGGGGGGYESSTDYSNDSSQHSDEPVESGGIKEIGNVTVKSKKKNNTVLYIVIGLVIASIAVFLIMKKKK